MKTITYDIAANVYTAMLSAAPTPPAQPIKPLTSTALRPSEPPSTDEPPLRP